MNERQLLDSFKNEVKRDPATAARQLIGTMALAATLFKGNDRLSQEIMETLVETFLTTFVELHVEAAIKERVQ